jgi:pyruvate kinase
MHLPDHKTKIVCTIGPASSAVPVIEELIHSGMDVARINFSHGTREDIRQFTANVREAARRAGKPVAILADLPGAKIRLGTLVSEPLYLGKGHQVILTTGPYTGAPGVLPVDYPPLAQSVAVGGKIYINDGFIELRVDAIAGTEVTCTVVMGGPVVSRKGLNLPGARLLIDPVTPRDLELLEFGLQEGIDTYGISFVEKAADIVKVRDHAVAKGHTIHTVAKIERGNAVKNIDEILNVADAVMIARGDLGVEMPIEEVPAIQKKLIRKANLASRPVIIATQMLESMKNNTRPTRAEVSDVANAILDGTDAIMLSEETAVGKYPAETVRMMASIAAYSESQRSSISTSNEEVRWYLKNLAGQGKLTIPDVISRNAAMAADVLSARFILTPTDTGSTSRRVARFKPSCWVLAFSRHETTCRFLSFSYGVLPFHLDDRNGSWHQPIREFLQAENLVTAGDNVIITEGRFVNQPGGTDSLEILVIGTNGTRA